MLLLAILQAYGSDFLNVSVPSRNLLISCLLRSLSSRKLHLVLFRLTRNTLVVRSMVVVRIPRKALPSVGSRSSQWINQPAASWVRRVPGRFARLAIATNAGTHLDGLVGMLMSLVVENGYVEGCCDDAVVAPGGSWVGDRRFPALEALAEGRRG